MLFIGLLPVRVKVDYLIRMVEEVLSSCSPVLTLPPQFVYRERGTKHPQSVTLLHTPLASPPLKVKLQCTSRMSEFITVFIAARCLDWRV